MAEGKGPDNPPKRCWQARVREPLEERLAYVDAELLALQERIRRVLHTVTQALKHEPLPRSKCLPGCHPRATEQKIQLIFW